MRAADWVGTEQRLVPLRAEALKAAGLILGRRQLAEDAVQEAFIRAAFALPGLRDPGVVRGWFRRIVVHEALRLARRDGRELAAADPRTAETAPGADERLVEADAREAARRALASLSPGLRAAAALHHGLGLPVHEVAAILGVPVGTVKSRCSTARRALRARIDRPLTEVLTLADEAVRLATGAEMEAMNRDWTKAGHPEPELVSEEGVRDLFPEVSWPAVGLPFHFGRLVRGEGPRMGWAFYGDGTHEVMVSLFEARSGWHPYVHDDSGGAVRTEACLRGTLATWVTRPDGVHYAVFRVGAVDVGIAGNVGAERIRALAEGIDSRG